MRRRSVVDELRVAQREEVASLSPAERVRLALSLGSQSLDLLRARGGLSAEQAREAREERLQAHRRPSACLRALRS